MRSTAPVPSAVLRGYALVLALGAAAVVVLGLRMRDEDRLDETLAAAHRGDLLAVLDEVSAGRFADFMGKASTYRLGDFAAPVEAPAPRAREVPSEAIETARPPPADEHLVDPTHRLDSFFAALGKLEAGRRQKVRILYFGTSEIGHDRVTSQMRRQLQARFGDGGKGWVLVDRTWSILGHRDIAWTHDEPGWRSFSIRTGTQAHGHYGLGGVLFKSIAPAWVEWATVGEGQGIEDGYAAFPSGTAWSRAELHYQAHPDGRPFSIILDNEPRSTVPTVAERIEDRSVILDLDDGPHSVRVETKEAGVHVYGAVFERDTGVVLDALMVIGAWGDSITHYEPNHLRAQIDLRDPALMIFQLGAKESLRSPTLSGNQVDAFEAGFRRSVEMAMAGRGDVACLIISPKDQGWGQGGRIETRPAIPRLVAATARVAEATGCAHYDLFAAMGGEGTMRRWFHQKPRLVSGDYGHLKTPGSIRVGDMLTDLLLEEYEVYRTWADRVRVVTKPALVVELPRPDPSAVQALAAVPDDDGLVSIEPCIDADSEATDCRDPMSYIRSNERGVPLWAPFIADRGGGFVGIGFDDNYSLMAVARSRWAWVLSDDPTILALHRILRALVLASETPAGVARALAAGNLETTKAELDRNLQRSAVPESARRFTLGVFADVAGELQQHVRRSRRERPLFPDWGWLHVPEQYAHVRALFEQDRVRVVGARVDGERALSGVAKSAAAIGVPVRVVYVPADGTRQRPLPRAARANLRALPFDEASVVLRTVDGRKLNKKRGFSKWHYVVHHGPHLRELLVPRSRGRLPRLLAGRSAVSDYLSWVGPPDEEPPALAAGTEGPE
jgi:hypothetical protein